MSLVKFEKRNNLRPLVNIFDDFFGREFNEVLYNDSTAFKPAVNVIEKDDKFEIELAAPGLSKADFKVNIDKDLLTISLNKETSKENTEETQKGRYTRKEFGFTSFKRSFNLPKSVNKDAINGRYEAGILYLDLPKLEEAKEKPARDVEIG